MRNLERREYSQKEISANVLDVFRYYDSYRKQFEDKAVEWYKKFVGYKEEVSDEQEGVSNLHIPKTYEILDTIRARIVSSIFNQRPYIEFTPMPEAGSTQSMAANEEKAKVAASFVDEQLEKNDVKSVFYDFVTSMLIFPAAFMGVGWRYEEDYIKRKTKVPVQDQMGKYTGEWRWDIVEKNEVIWDDNEIFNIDFFDFWGDPDNTDIDDARAVFHREFTTKGDLKNQLELLARIGDGRVYDIDFDKLSSARTNYDRGRYKRLSAVGITNTGTDPFSSDDVIGTDKEEVEVLHYWEDDRHIMLINRDKVVYDGPNPYWRHMKKPFIKATYDQLPNQFYGMSAVQIIEHMQEELNTMHNQRMDNVNFLINNMWKRLRGSDIRDEQLISRPNGVIDVDSMEDLQMLEKSEIPQSAFMSEQKLASNLEMALGTPANVRGADAGGDQSATEASIKAQAAQTRFGAKIELFKTVGIKRLALMMDLNNQQFICDRRAARLDPEERNSWQSFDPDYIVGEFDYSPATSSAEAAANKELRREQLTQIMNFLMQAQVPFVNYKKLVTEWLKEFDIKNPEKFMIPEEQYEILKRQAIEEFTAQPGVIVDDQMNPNLKQFTSQGGTGNLGKSQISGINRQAGGLTAEGTPQPQPGQRGGMNSESEKNRGFRAIRQG